MVVIGLSACVTAPRTPRSSNEELITYRTENGPFCGRCDNLVITALSDGRVWVEHGYWAGRYRDWRVERRERRITPAQFARYRDYLAAYRPSGDLTLIDKPPCSEFYHDIDGVRIEWRDRAGTSRLHFNYGCEPANRAAMAKALRIAPDVLGLKLPFRPRGQWVATTRAP